MLIFLLLISVLSFSRSFLAMFSGVEIYVSVFAYFASTGQLFLISEYVSMWLLEYLVAFFFRTAYPTK